jgi:hypothetical protein
MFVGFILKKGKNMEERKIKRNIEIKLKLGKEEKEKLEKRAEQLGICLSAYIRMISINANIELK